jgi:hypothetical protein
MNGFTGSSMIEAAPLARNLTTLIVSLNCDITLDAVTRLLSLCDKLERAEFHSIYSSGAVAQWQIGSKLRTLAQSCPRLGICQCHIKYGTHPAGLVCCVFTDSLSAQDSLFDQIPNVRELCLHGWEEDSAFDHPDLSKLRNLRSLKLYRPQLRVFPKLPTAIRNLDLSYNYNMDLHCLESRQNLEDYNLLDLEFLDLRCS